MVRVCHVTSVHPARDGRIFEHYCRSLNKKYEVFLVAPNTETCVVDGIHIIGVSLPDTNHRIKRWLKLPQILPVLLDINAEVYHFHDPELMSLGLKLKKKGKKIIFDSHEDTLNQISSKSYIPTYLRGIVGKLYKIHEQKVLKQYTALVSVTDYIVDRLKSINTNTFQITNYPTFVERELNQRKWDRTVCFAGLLSRYWMLKEIVNCLPKINARMYLAGRYYTDDYLNQLKSLPGWSNVEFEGLLPHESVIDMYLRASVGLAIESYDNPNAGYRAGSLGCTKIPEYMSVGLPIVVSNSDVWGSVVRKYKCGLAVENPNDSEEIAKAISYILDNPQEAKIMGENGLLAAKSEFNWSSQEEILFKLYKSILSQ